MPRYKHFYDEQAGANMCTQWVVCTHDFSEAEALRIETTYRGGIERLKKQLNAYSEEAIAAQGISGTAVKVYFALLDVALMNLLVGITDEQQKLVFANVTRKTIGALIGKSERTAQRAIKELKAAGLITVKRKGWTGIDLIYFNNIENHSEG